MSSYYAFSSGLYEHTISEDTACAIVEIDFISNNADRAFLVANRDLVARAIALGIARFLGARPAEGWPTPPALPRGDIVEVLHDNVPLRAAPAEDAPRVDRAARRERFAVIERRPGWARLFFYSGKEAWVQDWRTRQIAVP